jgi:hypothetical protein
MMRMIILKRLMQIKENLEELLPELDSESKIYKEAVESIKRIENTLSKSKIEDLPEDVHINTTQLKFDGPHLSGKVLMTDNEKVYYLTVVKNEVKDMKVFNGGIKKMQLLESTIFKPSTN